MEESSPCPSQFRPVGLVRPKKNNSNKNSNASGSPEDSIISLTPSPTPPLNTNTSMTEIGERRSTRIAARTSCVTNNMDFVPASVLHQAHLRNTPTGSKRFSNFVSPSIPSPIPLDLSFGGDDSLADASLLKAVDTWENEGKESPQNISTDMFEDSLAISENDLIQMEMMYRSASASLELMKPPKTPVVVVKENSTHYEDNVQIDNVQIKRLKSSFEDNIPIRNGPYKNPLPNNINQNQKKKYEGRGGKKPKPKTYKKRPFNGFKVAYTNRKHALELSKSGINELSMQSIHELSHEQRLSLANWELPPQVLWKYHQKQITSLFEWQLECLGNEKVLGGKNLLYSAPTSAGKTMVAEILMLKRVYELGKKAIMILPFVSVAREKMYSLQDLFGGTGIRVEGFMGSYNPPGGFKAVDIAICTIEKANSLINRLIEENQLHLVGTIIVDELHLLGDPQRGYLLELLLTKIRYLSLTCKANEEKEASASDPEKNELKNEIEKQMLKVKKREPINIQIIGMSATLPNLGLLAKWLDAELLTTDYRPVPLVELIKIDGQLLDVNLEPVRQVVNKSIPENICGEEDTDKILYLSLQTVLDGHSILIFCNSKANCEYTAKKIAETFSKIGHGEIGNSVIQKRLRDQLNTESITAVYQQLKQCPFDVDKRLEQSIMFGVAFHHAGLTYEERDIVESAFKRGAIRVLTATTTLSAGVNLPARRVIIRTPKFYPVLDALTYKQMVGRAGRKGQDTEGESILITDKSTSSIGKNLIQQKLNPISSALLGINGKLSKPLKRAILEVLVSGIVTSRNELLNYIDYTLLALTLSTKENEITYNKVETEEPLSLEKIKEDIVTECIEYLTELDFVRAKKKENEDESKFSATNLGSACLASSLSPDEGMKVFKELLKARETFVLDGDLHVIYQVTPIYLSNQWEKLDWDIYMSIWEKLTPFEQRVGNLVGVKQEVIAYSMAYGFKKTDNSDVYIRFYTALALNDLVNEIPVSDIVRKFNVDKGMVQNLQQSAAIFAGMVTTFCQRLGYNNLEAVLCQFQERLQFGVRKELVDLCKLSLMNGSRARILYQAGIKTIPELANCDPVDIELYIHRATAYDGNSNSNSNNVWIIGKTEALTEEEFAIAIIKEARDYISIELGLGKKINFGVNNSNGILENDEDSDNDQESEAEQAEELDDNDTNAESDVNSNKNETNNHQEEGRCSSILFESFEGENVSENAIIYKSSSVPRDHGQLLNEASPSIIEKSDSLECDNIVKLMDKSMNLSNVQSKNGDSDSSGQNQIFTPRNSIAEIGETPEDNSEDVKHSTPLVYCKQKHKGAHAVDSILSTLSSRGLSESQSIPRARKKAKLDKSKNESISDDSDYVFVSGSEDMFKEFKKDLPQPEPESDLKNNDASDDVFEMIQLPENSDTDSDDQDDLDLTNNENIITLKQEFLPNGNIIKINMVNSYKFLPKLLFSNANDAILGLAFEVNRPQKSFGKNGIGSKIVKTVEEARLGSGIEYTLSFFNSNDESTIWILKWKDFIIEKLEIVKLFKKIKRHNINLAIIDSSYCIKRIIKHHQSVNIYDQIPNEKSIWDPKVAEWLLQCEDDEKDKQLSLEGLISKHLFKNFEWRYDQEKFLKPYFVCKLMLVLKDKLSDKDLWNHFKDVEMAHISTLVLMELNGFGICHQELEKIKRLLTFKSALLELKAFQIAKKQFNLSVPSEIKAILVNDFHVEEAIEGTSKSILEKIIQIYDLELAKVIIEWRKINSALSKVVEFNTEYLKKGRKNRIRGYCTHFTVTGRIVMSDPNLQCVPKSFNRLVEFTKKDFKELERNMKSQVVNFGSKTTILLKDLTLYSKEQLDEILQVQCFNVRKMFVPQNEDFILVSADYSQLELRILASLSEDPKLLIALADTSSDVFKSITSIWKEISIDEVTDEMRQETKGLVYGIIYGMGMKALSEMMEVTEEEARTFSSTFLETYPGLKTFKANTIKVCRENLYIKTVTQRRRYLPSIRSDKRDARAKAERQALNSTIQGSATDLVKKATVKLQKRLNSLLGSTRPLNDQESQVEPDYYPILNLHDELIFEVRRTKLESFVRELHGVMSKDVGNKFKNVCFPVVIKVGESWGDMKHWEISK